MKAQLKVRPAAESDLDAVYELVCQLGYSEVDPQEFAATYSEIAARPDMVLLVAERAGGELVGLMSLSHRPQLRLAGTLLAIDELVVKETERGTGVGSQLVERAKAAAREIGARRLQLETNRARESYLRGFYVKQGFSEANSALMRLDELAE